MLSCNVSIPFFSCCFAVVVVVVVKLHINFQNVSSDTALPPIRVAERTFPTSLMRKELLSFEATHQSLSSMGIDCKGHITC